MVLITNGIASALEVISTTQLLCQHQPLPVRLQHPTSRQCDEVPELKSPQIEESRYYL